MAQFGNFSELFDSAEELFNNLKSAPALFVVEPRKGFKPYIKLTIVNEEGIPCGNSLKVDPVRFEFRFPKEPIFKQVGLFRIDIYGGYITTGIRNEEDIYNTGNPDKGQTLITELNFVGQQTVSLAEKFNDRDFFPEVYFELAKKPKKSADEIITDQTM